MQDRGPQIHVKIGRSLRICNKLNVEVSSKHSDHLSTMNAAEKKRKPRLTRMLKSHKSDKN
ncbi:hypothetical protein M408DRAFT_29459 [Serendipita vermifera MAFF 305830]|uniref:Uncharacterized protein n=1 Tax=Serendipita vermifera MAFF 305830 TaxID=933852 RepID=A0A0C2W523_SERVB|nr:hypothetical protein M408DRAFT_29459 [Serendipita vermifera MAFF 305830]